MIEAGFISLTIFMATLVYAGITQAYARTGGSAQQKRKFGIIVLVLLTGWLSYVTLISLSGALATLAMPPRIPLLLILPCFAFMAWFFSSGRFKELIASTPAAWVVYAQSFRILVELLLHALFLKGILPKAATYEGYNYEIIVAIAAPIVAYLAIIKKVLPPITVFIWNIAGLCTLAIIVFIAISHAYFPGIYANPETLSIRDFGSFPFTLLAGFLMPVAVFMHIYSLAMYKLKQKEQHH
jgi:hypothetical protein